MPRALLAAALLAALASCGAPALAHDWFATERNPKTQELCCCAGQDCDPVEIEDWDRVGPDYVVRWKDGRTYSIPADQAGPSRDVKGRAAACVLAGRLRCFFVPQLF